MQTCTSECSPVLAPLSEGQHGDLLAFLEHCWGCLTPSELACAVYPVLSAYANPETLVSGNPQSWHVLCIRS